MFQYVSRFASWRQKANISGTCSWWAIWVNGRVIEVLSISIHLNLTSIQWHFKGAFQKRLLKCCKKNAAKGRWSITKFEISWLQIMQTFIDVYIAEYLISMWRSFRITYSNFLLKIVSISTACSTFYLITHAHVFIEHNCISFQSNNINSFTKLVIK